MIVITVLVEIGYVVEALLSNDFRFGIPCIDYQLHELYISFQGTISSNNPAGLRCLERVGLGLRLQPRGRDSLFEAHARNEVIYHANIETRARFGS